jgi:alpha,alpha-trehalase
MRQGMFEPKSAAVFALAMLIFGGPHSGLTRGLNRNRNSPERSRDMNAKLLLAELSAAFDKLRPQVIMPAEGFIKHDYLIPAGFYKQMWDWDGFFIGCHLASRSRDETKYLKWWVLNFAEAVDDEGYVPGCITPQGPRPLFGKFAMKPFLCQGAYFASERLGDFSWVVPVYEGLKKVVAYRERSQADSKYGLFFWDNAMQSGADNNAVLTNDPGDPSAILAADINTFQLREYLALSRIAAELGRAEDAILCKGKAGALQAAMVKHLWFEDEVSFFNIRRDTGLPIKRISYSNFVPLIQKILPAEDGRRMIERYLWNKDHLLSDHGLRTLSRKDADYNNKNIIIPYSNWQGPVWPIADYLYFIGLENYGFDREAASLAETLGRLMLADIRACGSMHENYDAETGVPLAPTAAQSKDGVFTGFVGWNLLILNMLQAVVEGKWLLLELPFE